MPLSKGVRLMRINYLITDIDVAKHLYLLHTRNVSNNITPHNYYLLRRFNDHNKTHATLLNVLNNNVSLIINCHINQERLRLGNDLNAWVLFVTLGNSLHLNNQSNVSNTINHSKKNDSKRHMVTERRFSTTTILIGVRHFTRKKTVDILAARLCKGLKTNEAIRTHNVRTGLR